MAEKRASSPPVPPAPKRNRGLSFEQEQTCVNNIRTLAVDMVEKANSGHPGAPMGCAPIAHMLFGSVMNYAPTHPKWFNRDRFVLSNGHACALLYAMLHLTGYPLDIEELKRFRQLGSLTPGHPENFMTAGVEVSTGPLGQGISNAVGLAIAEKHLAAHFNRDGFNLIDHYTYVICGDGCLQEGVSSEASSLAGHLGLGKLIVCYDDNKITIDGDTSLSFTEDVGKRYEAYGWQVLTVQDGNDLNELQAAIETAKLEANRPTLIKVHTLIGFGSSKAGSHSVHGAPLGATDTAQVKQRFGFDPTKTFEVKPEVYDFYRQQQTKGETLVAAWDQLVAQYTAAHPDLANELTRRIEGRLPDFSHVSFPAYSSTDTKAVATRNRSEEMLNFIAPLLPELIGGSADLTPSNLTFLKCTGDFQRATPGGRYIRFGVREHGMAAICNGLFAHGGLRPYCATFLNFIGYAMGAVRVSALSRFGILYVMTHDSIGLGEDGPTHQPIEMLQSLRAMPNLLVFRPADGNETAGAYQVALEHAHTPSVLSLSRQGVPTLAGTSAAMVRQGGYVVHDFPGTTNTTRPDLILIGTGTELSLAVKVAETFIAQHPGAFYLRVVSMVSCELFDAQPVEYQLSVLTPGAAVMSIEAGGVTGWQKYAHAPCGIDGVFGLSAPADKLYQHFGLTVPTLVQRCSDVLAFYTDATTGKVHAPSLLQRPHFAAPAPLH